MYTRYSSAQMLVMLWGTGQENVFLIIDRVNALLQMEGMPSAARVTFTVLAGDEAPQFMHSVATPAKKKSWRKLDGAISAI